MYIEYKKISVALGDFDKNSRNFYSPNMIIFPFVLSGISRRKQKFNDQSYITIDRQVHFNDSQMEMFKSFKNMEGHAFQLGPHLPTQVFDELPKNTITFKSEDTSIGLELLDIVLWIFNRYQLGKLKNKLLIERLFNFFEYYDEISYASILSKWNDFDRKVPQIDEFNKEQLEKGFALIERDRNELKSRMKGN